MPRLSFTCIAYGALFSYMKNEILSHKFFGYSLKVGGHEIVIHYNKFLITNEFYDANFPIYLLLH